MKRWAKPFVFLLPLCAFLQGCATILATQLPVARPPEELVSGVTQARVDYVYGAPIAAGMSADNREYVEQVKFVDGVRVGWKITRICVHVWLDLNTFFIWEVPGTLYESLQSYPEYVYFLVYDKENQLVRAVPADSPEGEAFMNLPWAVQSFDLWRDCDGINVTPSPLRLAPEMRP